jgi:hypothetical protein
MLNYIVRNRMAQIKATPYKSVRHTTDYSNKGKAVPQHTYAGASGERRYSSYSFTTSALDGGEWSVSRPGRDLPSGKGRPVPIGKDAGWAPEPVWTQRLEEKSLACARDRTSISRSSSP